MNNTCLVHGVLHPLFRHHTAWCGRDEEVAALRLLWGHALAELCGDRLAAFSLLSLLNGEP